MLVISSHKSFSIVQVWSDFVSKMVGKKLPKSSPMTNLFRIKSVTHPYKQEFCDLKFFFFYLFQCENKFNF